MKFTIDTDTVVKPVNQVKENIAANVKEIKDSAVNVFKSAKDKIAPMATAVKEYGLGIISREDVHYCAKCGINIEEFGQINFCPRCGKRI